MAGRRIKPRACILDIEATALDADIGHLVGAGLMELDGEFRWFYVRRPADEAKILKKVLKEVSAYHIIFTWNGKGFDIPFLISRAIKLKLPAEELLKPVHVDLAEFVRENLRLHRSDLYHVARFLGIKKDLRVEGFDVPSIYLKALRGDREAAKSIEAHCRDDLEVTRKILKRLLPIIRAKQPELIL